MRTYPVARKTGKTQAIREQVRAALHYGEHVHVLQPGGVACSRTPPCELTRQDGTKVLVTHLTDAEQIG